MLELERNRTGMASPFSDFLPWRPPPLPPRDKALRR